MAPPVPGQPAAEAAATTTPTPRHGKVSYFRYIPISRLILKIPTLAAVAAAAAANNRTTNANNTGSTHNARPPPPSPPLRPHLPPPPPLPGLPPVPAPGRSSVLAPAPALRPFRDADARSPDTPRRSKKDGVRESVVGRCPRRRRNNRQVRRGSTKIRYHGEKIAENGSGVNLKFSLKVARKSLFYRSAVQCSGAGGEKTLTWGCHLNYSLSR